MQGPQARKWTPSCSNGSARRSRPRPAYESKGAAFELPYLVSQPSRDADEAEDADAARHRAARRRSGRGHPRRDRRLATACRLQGSSEIPIHRTWSAPQAPAAARAPLRVADDLASISSRWAAATTASGNSPTRSSASRALNEACSGCGTAPDRDGPRVHPLATILTHARRPRRGPARRPPHPRAHPPDHRQQPRRAQGPPLRALPRDARADRARRGRRDAHPDPAARQPRPHRRRPAQAHPRAVPAAHRGRAALPRGSRRTLSSRPRPATTKRAELEELVNVKIRENAIAIGRAAELGDLSENSEYKFALEERDLLQARLAQMQKEMDLFRPLKPGGIPPTMPASAVASSSSTW
ncbi:MAG: hypothetical protein H6816_11410 [Phycisphaerales bacterium]|nr:hypothetical protein [Phycisphaerales bacterium]